MELPTLTFEGFGLVTVESLAGGTPVLGTSIGATPEIPGQIDSRLLATNHIPDALADALRRLIIIIKGNPSEWINICKKCQELSHKVYTWGESFA